MTTFDAARVDALRDTDLPIGTKGLPLSSAPQSLAAFADAGHTVIGGDLPMPVAILRRRDLESNITAMQEFCDATGALLAPHGKTTMAPQVFARQIEIGAWALTAATPAHLRLYRDFGVGRIIYANQLVEKNVISWLASEIASDEGFDFYCLADSVAAVDLLELELARSACPRPVNVLIEVGHADGRCGIRDVPAAQDVAAAIDKAPHLRLVGVECFEGLLPGGGIDTSAVDEFLVAVRAIAGALVETSSLRSASSILITAGGSLWFDRVLTTFANPGWPVPARIVLRSGCYVTQDGGMYDRGSPLAGRRNGEALLHNALEVWSTVLSRPEPGLILTSMGRRDCSFDAGLPVPVKIVRQGSGSESPHRLESLSGATTLKLSDQHAHVAVPTAADISVGDLICSTVSHPCTTLDKWKVLAVVDDDYRVVDAVLTFF
ncbi:amino acid deaminase [Gordonia sp. CPCC 205333]|uniref:amino acid deaminase n=1 Tax=Gordonia sp. CPCC 205333 TaxID=3140790 RepID=UPI003AF3A349